MQYIITILLVVASGAYYLGSLSYLAVGVLILINLFTNKLSILRYICIFSLILLFSFNLIRVPVIADFDYVALNFFLQILFLLSINFRNVNYHKCIFTSLKIQICISVVLSFFGWLTNNMSMFVDADSAKGFSGLFAMRGIYSTPQLLASVCLALVFFSRYRVLQSSSTKFSIVALLSIMVASLNRVNAIGLCLLIFYSLQKYKRKSLVLIINMLIVLAVIIFSVNVNLDKFANFQTMESRSLLIEGIIGCINTDSIISVIFGDFEKIYFYIPQYLIYVSYVENGFLFILKYYGIMGLLFYVVICMIFIYKLKRNNHNELALYAFIYLFIIQNFTNEFLVSVFPQITSLMLFINYCTKRENIVYNN